MARHYLDHASTSPARPEVVAAITQWLSHPGGDPGRIHAEGLEARVAVENARDEIAALFGARPRSVVLTSGATEAIASACWGAAERGDHQVLAAVEHSAVRLGAEAVSNVTVVGADGTGRIDLGELLDAGAPGDAVAELGPKRRPVQLSGAPARLEPE